MSNTVMDKQKLIQKLQNELPENFTYKMYNKIYTIGKIKIIKNSQIK